MMRAEVFAWSIRRSYLRREPVGSAKLKSQKALSTNMKPPAFQFYVKDWRSSATVHSMTREERGLYIDLMALAWDSEIPGTIDIPFREICRELRVFSATLRRFLADFPATFQKVGGKLVQPKLAEQWAKYSEISQKRSAAASKCLSIAGQKHHTAFAVASASAIATAKTNTESEGFLLFCENYPQAHLGVKSEALRAWIEIPSADLHMGEILEGIEAWKVSEQWEREGGRFIPQARRFLQAKQWRVAPRKTESEEFNERFNRIAAERAGKVGSAAR